MDNSNSLPFLLKNVFFIVIIHVIGQEYFQYSSMNSEFKCFHFDAALLIHGPPVDNIKKDGMDKTSIPLDILVLGSSLDWLSQFLCLMTFSFTDVHRKLYLSALLICPLYHQSVRYRLLKVQSP